jgi:hypothetical protein
LRHRYSEDLADALAGRVHGHGRLRSGRGASPPAGGRGRLATGALDPTGAFVRGVPPGPARAR